MYYSLTFGSQKNTWTNWHLIPDSPPVIPTPEPQMNIVSIPGRTDGGLDLSLVPFGRLQYGRMTGNWNFILGEDYIKQRDTILADMRTYLNGKSMAVELETEPATLYRGIFVVGTPRIGANTVTIQIGFNLEPRRWLIPGHAQGKTPIPALDPNYP